MVKYVYVYVNMLNSIKPVFSLWFFCYKEDLNFPWKTTMIETIIIYQVY